MQSVVITGASTGIGWATSKLLLDRGFRVFGSVRKPADADCCRAELGVNFTAAFAMNPSCAVAATLQKSFRIFRTLRASHSRAPSSKKTGVKRGLRIVMLPES